LFRKKNVGELAFGNGRPRKMAAKRIRALSQLHCQALRQFVQNRPIGKLH